LRGQEDIMKQYIDLLIKRLRERASSATGNIVDMVKWYNFTTFDLIGDLTFGEPFGCLENGGYHPWVAMIFGGFKLASYTQAAKRFPRIEKLLMWLIPKQLFQKKYEHFSMSFEKARKRAETGAANREDFMSYVLRHSDEKGMTPNEIGENSNVLIVAGSETTATLLSGTTYLLLKNPEIYKKLADEIRANFTKEEDITLLAVSNMKYLIAVFSEGLRMYPPVPSGLPRKVPAGGEFVEGYWFPEEVSNCKSATFLSHDRSS
jgi:cytochrome P450